MLAWTRSAFISEVAGCTKTCHLRGSESPDKPRWVVPSGWEIRAGQEINMFLHL